MKRPALTARLCMVAAFACLLLLTPATAEPAGVAAANGRDTARVRALADTAFSLARDEAGEAVAFARQALLLADSLDDQWGMALSYNRLAFAYERRSLYDSAFANAFASLALYGILSDPAGQANALKDIATVHYRKGSYDSSYHYLFRSIRLAEKARRPDIKALDLQLYGSLLRQKGMVRPSIRYLNEALRLLSVSGTRPAMAARVREDLALSYMKLGRLDTAQRFLDRALHAYDSLGDRRGLARVNLNLAKLSRKKGSPFPPYAEYALDYYRRVGHPNGIALACLELAETSEALGQDREAIGYARKALEQAVSIGNKNCEMDGYALLDRVYYRLGDYRNAYAFQKKKAAISDSLLGWEKQTITAELQARYESEKKDKEIRLLNKDNEIKALAIRKQQVMRNAVAGGLVLLVVIGLLVFNRYRSRQQARRQSERMRISTDLHDDMGSTISSIGMYSAYAAQKLDEGKTDEARGILAEISQSAMQMIEDMHDLIWSVNPRNDSCEKMINRLRNYTSRMAQSRDIILDFRVEESLQRLSLDPEPRKNIYLMCKEAVNNAVKYSKCGKLDLAFRCNGRQLRIRIADDGIGFDPQANHEGSGLRNLRERSDRIGSALSIVSSRGRGTTMDLRYLVS